MDLERRILMSQLRSWDWQARDGPRKEKNDVSVAVVGWVRQRLAVKRKLLMSQLQ